MPQDLLEYQVFRSVQAFDGTTVPLISAGVVPLGQTWRVDQMTVCMFAPEDYYSEIVQPSVVIYDQGAPGPTSVPAQHTRLAYVPTDLELFPGGPQLWADVDDGGSPITVVGGGELVVVFLADDPGADGVSCAVRIQYGVFQGTAAPPQPAAGLVPGPTIPVDL